MASMWRRNGLPATVIPCSIASVVSAAVSVLPSMALDVNVSLMSWLRSKFR